MNEEDEVLTIEDFEELARLGIEKITMNKHNYNKLQNSLQAKKILFKDTNSISPNTFYIHTDHGKVSIVNEKNEETKKLDVDQIVQFNSPFDIGDLVKYIYEDEEDKETAKRKVRYSKIVKIIPYIDVDHFYLGLEYKMENGRYINSKLILTIEVKANDTTGQSYQILST